MKNQKTISLPTAAQYSTPSTHSAARSGRHPAHNTLARVFVLLLICVFMFSTTAFAKAPAIVAPSDLINVVAERTGLPADLDALVYAGYLTAPEKRHLEKYDTFSNAVAWHVLLPAFGLYPYPAEFYPEIAPHPSWPNGTVYADARAAGIMLNLVDPQLEPNYAMTKSDFNVLVQKLKTTSFTLPVPSTTYPFIAVQEEAADATGLEPWDIHTYLGRNSVLSAYHLIPAGWLAEFNSRGWHINFTLPHDHPNPKLLNYVSAGCTNFQTSTISIANPKAITTLHEFAHFAAKYGTVYLDDMEYCFNREASGVANILGLYAMTSPSEYLAEFTAYWLLYPDKQNTLRELAPASADLTEYLIHAFDDQPALLTAA